MLILLALSTTASAGTKAHCVHGADGLYGCYMMWDGGTDDLITPRPPGGEFIGDLLPPLLATQLVVEANGTYVSPAETAAHKVLHAKTHAETIAIFNREQSMRGIEPFTWTSFFNLFK